MSSKGNAGIATFLACLALVATVCGQWMTRPGNMDLWGSVVAVAVIYAIVVGAPQILMFAAALSCTKQGRTPASEWWTAAYLVFVLQVGAGASFVAGSILGEERLFSVAAVVLVVAAMIAVASGLLASRVAYHQGQPAKDA